ncbi:MAG: TolC family protein [Ignavibacteriales bacterium]|nr:TolC family protein [Ignavibacteriales bacterium]
MKYANAMLLLAVLFLQTAMAQSVHPLSVDAKAENIQELITEALSRNPEIAVEMHKMEAARARVPQAGALMDPELNFKLMEIPGTDFNKATFANIELMQVVTFPAKLSTQRSIAELLTEHAQHEHMETVLAIVAQLKTSLAMLWFARESLTLNTSNRDILTKILRSAETAYTVGKASQQEVLKTNIELARISMNEAKIREQITSSESTLRALLNRKSTAPIGQIDVARGPVPLPTIDALLAYAHRNRPMLMHDSLNVLEKSLTISLMKKEYLPDFKFSVEYVRMPVMMENRWSVSAGITLPFAPWSIAKATSRVQEAEAEHLMISSMYTASQNNVELQIRSGYASLQSLETQFLTIRNTILPQLRQSIQLLLSEYETGTTSYMMVLDGYRMFNEMQLDYAMAQMSYQETLASLERSVGVTDIQFVASFGKDHHQ